MQRLEIVVGSVRDEAGVMRYQAELLVRPFSGWILAKTRLVSTKGWAQRDGCRVFGPMIAEQNREIMRRYGSGR